MVDAPREYRLTPRDVEILNHIRAFRMTTMEVLHRLFFEGQDIEAVKSWQRRLRHAGFIETAHFIKPRKYIFLTGDAVQKLYGEPEKAGGALSPFVLARQYGALAFCCLTGSVHRKLTFREFREKFPALAENKRLPTDFYYIDKDTQPNRLGFIYVDHGRRAERIYQRYRQIVAQRYKLQTWREQVINRDRFIVAVVVAKQEKRARVEEAFRARRPTVAYRVEVVPDLIHLI
jgi:hypothetical protein